MRTAEEVREFELSLYEEDAARRGFLVSCFSSGVPRSFWLATSKDVAHNKEVFQAYIRPYAAKRKVILAKGYGMVLIGDNGSGKTMFSSYVSTQFLRRGNSVYYTTAPGLDEDFKRGFRDEAFSKRLNSALESELLVLDELGKELSPDGYFGVRLESLLKSRYDEAMPTIIATNLDWMMVVKRYGASIESMLEGRYLKIALEAGDMRRSSKARMKKDMGL